MPEQKPIVNVDYVGTVVHAGNSFKYTKVDIQKSIDTIADLKNMKENPNRTRMDMQSLFQMRFPNRQFFNYSLPHSYNDSFIEGISYPSIWDQDKYQQELNKRLPTKSNYPEDDLKKAREKLKEEYERVCTRYINGFDLYNTIEKVKSNPSVRMYSTETIGRTTMVYKISSDITITLKTNFSYGSASYFYVNLNYKGIDFLPYSAIVRYYRVNIVEFFRYTRQYYSKREYWDSALMFVVDTANFAKNNERDFLRQWCINEIDEMIEGLYHIKNISTIQQLTFDESEQNEYVYVRNISNDEKECAKVYPHEMMVSFKAEKITGALCLLTKMQQWTKIYEEVNDRIEKIKQMNIDILPDIETTIAKIEKDIKKQKDIIISIQKNELDPLIVPIAYWVEKEKIWLKERENNYISSEKEKILSIEKLDDEEKNKQIESIYWPSWKRENAKREFIKNNKDYQVLLIKRDVTYAEINRKERDIMQRTHFISQLSECMNRIKTAKIMASA